MDIYGEIRALRRDGISQRQIASTLGISRNTVKKYWDGETVPWERKVYQRNPGILTPEVTRFIQQCIEADQDAPKKQHHTAKRIYERLVGEFGFAGGETTVRRMVAQLREQTPEAFIPLAFYAGEAMQIDWGEATIYLDGVKTVANLFCARLCYSGAPFVRAYRRQNSESFHEAIIHAFEYFGGVPRQVIFDNAKIAVKDGFGAHAVKQAGYAALSAHYSFEAIFCNPASGNEKGLVEGLVGYIRRNTCVPVPHVSSMAELNERLLDKCVQYLNHHIRGKEAPVGKLLSAEKAALYPLPSYRFDPAKRAFARVDRFSTIRFDTNNYSVPIAYCGKELTVKALPETIQIFSNGAKIAEHSRCFGRGKNIYDLNHYLPLLAQKGRAIYCAKPVCDTVPASFLAWLKQQDLTPKQLTGYLERYLSEGCQAVMHTLPPNQPLHDMVQVQAVDLRIYDGLLAGKAGAAV